MAIQRECLGYIPTLPSLAGPGLWFDDPLEKQEGTIILLTLGGTAEAPVVPATPNRYYFSVSPLVGGFAGLVSTGWKGNFAMGFADWIDQANGEGVPLSFGSLGDVGDVGVLAIDAIIATPGLGITDTFGLRWINNDAGPSNPLVDAIAQVAGNTIAIEVPWVVQIPPP